MPSEKPVCSGLAERIGLDDSVITHKVFTGNEEKVVRHTGEIIDHKAGLQEIKKLLTNPEMGVIQDPEEIEAVGHRVVHGGESFSDTTVITTAVKQEVKKLFPLAPLHNPANYMGIEVAEKFLPKQSRSLCLILHFIKPCLR